MDDLIDPILANLVERNIMMRGIDADFIEDEFFLPLGHVLAAVAAPEFGQENNQAIWALKERAEVDLKYIYDQSRRIESQPRTMRTDYYPPCGRPFNWTSGC